MSGGKKKSFKVRIEKASLKTYWYAREIGQEFEVIDPSTKKYPCDSYRLVDDQKYIFKSDCEMV